MGSAELEAASEKLSLQESCEDVSNVDVEGLQGVDAAWWVGTGEGRATLTTLFMLTPHLALLQRSCPFDLMVNYQPWYSENNQLTIQW